MSDCNDENIISKINELQRQIKAEPTNILLQDRLGNLLIENNQLSEAAKQFGKIVSYYNNKVIYLKALAMCKRAVNSEALSQEAAKKIRELYSLLGISMDKH